MKKKNQETSSPSQKPTGPDQRIDTLFIRLGAIYGHVWWSSYSNERVLEVAKKEWSDGLKRFDNNTLRETLLKCREHFSYPPTLQQFIESCKAIIKRNELTQPQPKEPKQGLSNIGEQHLKAMLDYLKR